MCSGRIAAQQPCESMANASTPTCPAAPHTPTALLQLQMTSVCAQWMEDICLLTLQLHNPLGSGACTKIQKDQTNVCILSWSLSKYILHTVFTDAVGKMWVFGKVVAKVTGSKSLRLILDAHLAKSQKCSLLSVPINSTPTFMWCWGMIQQRLSLPKGQVWHFHPKIQEISHFCLLYAFGG